MKRQRDTATSCLNTRGVEALFTSPETLQCALNKNCVPCAYKICCFDVALDKEFTAVVPNQRPEQCKRANNNNNYAQVGHPYSFHKGMSVLTVGDGDFSFSLCLARILGSSLVATSYESEDTVVSVYPKAKETIRALKQKGVQVLFCVDATNLERTLELESKCHTLLLSFDRIVWNFPCQAVAKGKDGQNQEMDRNKQLVSSFVVSAYDLLKEKGQIQVLHKTKPPYNQWNIQEVVLGAENRLKYLCRLVFDRYLYVPYVPRKALDKKSFPSHDACIYLFGRKGGVGDGADRDVAKHCTDSLVRVDIDLIVRIRNHHLAQAKREKLKRKRR